MPSSDFGLRSSDPKGKEIWVLLPFFLITLPLADFIKRNSFLHAGFKSFHVLLRQSFVFCTSSLNTFPPHFKRTFFHFSAHKADDLLFGKSKLCFDGIKRRTVLPSHFYNPVNFLGFQFCCFLHDLKTLDSILCFDSHG